VDILAPFARVDRSARLALAALALAACGDPEGDGRLYDAEKKLEQVDAVLDRAEARAGATVTVRCDGRYSDGTVAPLTADQVTLKSEPAAGLQITGLSLKAVRAGRYTLSCDHPTAPVETPVELTVVPGGSVKSVAELDPASIAIQQTSAVRCFEEDAEGNRTESSGAAIGTTPARGVAIGGRTITGQDPGDYQVRCVLGNLLAEPAILTVTAGPPASITAALDRYTVTAGERIEVYCTVADAAGNVVPTATSFEVTPSPGTSDASGFVPHRAGQGEVVCALTAAGLRSAPVPFTTNPGPPASMEITGVSPQKALYARGDEVELALAARDTYGNDTGVAVEISAAPITGALPAGPRRASLIGNGTVQLIATALPPTHDNVPLSDSVTVEVDGLPPEIEILFPRRAEIVTAQPGVALTIRGRVTDAASAIGQLIVNGAPVAVAASGDFTTSMTPSWGINLIEARAVDASGNARNLAQSYELASSYRRASPSRTVSGRIMDGLVVRLGQSILDDNSSDVDDLATIARLAIENADLDALIPDPVTTYNSDCSIPFVTIRGSLRLYVDAVRFGTPTIDITAINGGLHLRVSVPSVAVDLHTSGDVCEVGVGIRGTASATRIVVEGDLLVSASGGQAVVTMPSRTVTITGLNINLALPSVIDWAIDGIINLFSGAIANQLESAFGSVIRTEIPPVVEDFLESIEIGTGFNLPAPLSLRLSVGSRLGMLAFEPGGGELGLDTTLYATGAISPEPVGGILQEQQILPTFGTTRPFGVGLGYDLINQALYSLWYGGGLAFDLSDSLFPSSQPNGGQMLQTEARIEALLPPVIGPSGDPAYPLELSVGDLRFDVDLSGLQGLPPIQATIFASATIHARITVDAAGALLLEVGPNPSFALDFTTPLDGVLDLAAFVDQLEATLGSLVPLIVGQVIQGIPLPTIDLSGIAGGVLPPGIVLGLGSPQVRYGSSYVLLEGSIVQRP
jgi:hypothetical protein